MQIAVAVLKKLVSHKRIPYISHDPRMVEKADRYPCTKPLEKHNFSPFLATQTMMLNKRKIK